MKYSLGIDIGGTKCTVILGGGEGEPRVIEKRVFQTQSLVGPDYAITKMFEILNSFFADYGVGENTFTGIGICCGGPLDSGNGIIVNPPNLPGWSRVPICRVMETKYHVPVVLENDANACALAEWRFGAARGFRNIVFLTFGTGLGAGLILNGKLYRGANDMAGEIGHVRLSDFGPVGYGKSGSFEGFCSGGGIAQLARIRVMEKMQKGEKQNLCRDIGSVGELNAKTVAEAADAGDELARGIYAECGKFLGKGLSAIIDFLNPEIIVLGSIYRRSENLMREQMMEVIRKESIEISRNACSIVPAQLGEQLGDYAALLLTLSEKC